MLACLSTVCKHLDWRANVPVNHTEGCFFLKFILNSVGGFGVAKNLSSWATQGKDCTVQSEVETTIKSFHSAKKPLGLCCISPVLAAKILPGCEVTVGCDKECEK